MWGCVSIKELQWRLKWSKCNRATIHRRAQKFGLRRGVPVQMRGSRLSRSSSAQAAPNCFSRWFLLRLAQLSSVGGQPTLARNRWLPWNCKHLISRNGSDFNAASQQSQSATPLNKPEYTIRSLSKPQAACNYQNAKSL
jgi:hypothetical protein